MKILPKKQFSHIQLASQKTGEQYSLSGVVSSLLGSKQLFIHHDILEPGRKSSGPHRHTTIEEVVFVAKGTVTVVEGAKEELATEGTLVYFDPNDKVMHFLVNRGEQNTETITFSVNSEFDKAVFNEEDQKIQMPGSHFDQDLKDVPDNHAEWIKFIDDLEMKLKDENHAAEKLNLNENLGMACRIVLRLEQAEKYLKKAVTLSYSHSSHGRLVQNLIRLAHVYQWKKEFEKAALLFDQAKSLLEEHQVSEGLRASYHQHLGKLYFDQRHFAQAKAEFVTALRLREDISAPPDQIESSKNSLKQCVLRLGE